jgi:hypothetical protein
VVPHSGADYATVREDGTIELRAHYLLRADDGTMIYIQNLGYLVRPRRPGSAVLFQADALFPGAGRAA